MSRWFARIAAVLGFAFLYAPIISLVVFSFNANRLVTVWSGFSTKSYADLLADPQILGAAWLSLRIAAISATIAPVTTGGTSASIQPAPVASTTSPTAVRASPVTRIPNSAFPIVPDAVAAPMGAMKANDEPR